MTYQNIGAATPTDSPPPGDARVALSWTSVSGRDQLTCTAARPAAATFLQSVTTTSFTNISLSNGTTYFYQVSATNGGGESAKSSEASATPQPAPPATPTGLTATPGDAQVALSWNSVSGATGYNTYNSTTSVSCI